MDFGKVSFNGIEIILTQQAYCNNEGQYLASGKDAAGNIYQVEWQTTKAWDDAQELARTTGEVDAFAEDESNACDWSSPVDVKLVESADE